MQTAPSQTLQTEPSRASKLRRLSRPVRLKRALSHNKQRPSRLQKMRRPRMKMMTLPIWLLRHRSNQSPTLRAPNLRAGASQMAPPLHRAHRRGSGSRTPSRFGSWTRPHGTKPLSSPLSTPCIMRRHTRRYIMMPLSRTGPRYRTAESECAHGFRHPSNMVRDV